MAKILCTLTKAGALSAANFYTEGEGSERLIEAVPAKGKKGAALQLSKVKRGYTAGDVLFRTMGLKPDGCRRYARHKLTDETSDNSASFDDLQKQIVKTRKHPRKRMSWHVWHEEVLLCWGVNTGICSKVGINAAVVFQYLWHSSQE